MEEERRLAFVALTRAEQRLFLSEADGRNFDGSPRYPSRFLLEIGREHLVFPREPREGLIQQTQEYLDRTRLLDQEPSAAVYRPGQRVRHFLFGPGTVLDVDLEKQAHVIQFDEMETPRRISFRAKLEAME